MNFQALRIMVDSLVQTFSCPECKSTVGEESIEIMGTAGQNINICVNCPKCKMQSIIRAQMVAMELPIQEIKVKAKEIDKQITKNMQKKLDEIETFKGHIEDMKINSKNSSLIKDSSIVELNKNLKLKNISMKELFGE